MFSSPLVGLVFFFIFTFKSVAGLHNVTIQENDPRIRYSDGGWTRVKDLSDKPTLLNCSDGLMETSIEGSFFEFNFTGTAVFLNVVDGAKGTFKAVLDDKPFAVDPGSDTTAHCRVAYSQTGLTDGPHRLVVFNSGNPSSLLFDSITFTASDPYDYGNPPRGSIPQSNQPFLFVNVRPQSPRVTASGPWHTVDHLSISITKPIDYCTDFAYQTSTIGSSLEFRFNGTAAQLITFDIPNSRNIITVSIDGQNEVVEGQQSSEGCTLAWQRQGLSPNVEHVLRITNTGPANMNEASLLTIDMIRYGTLLDDPTVGDPNNNGPGLPPLPDFIPYNDQPTNVGVIAGAVAAGISILGFVGFVFYWARRDRLKQAAMKLDEEKAISKQKWKEENHKNESAVVSMGDHPAPDQPSEAPEQSHVVIIPPAQDDTPRSSLGRPSTSKSSRKVGFLEVPIPSRS